MFTPLPPPDPCQNPCDKKRSVGRSGPPAASCTCNCNLECGYQQPPRAVPCIPHSSYIRPTAPIDASTVYKRSYIGNIGVSRVQPLRTQETMQRFVGPMDANTIQKLSYQSHGNVERAQPIRPRSNGLKFEGACYDITSQKHDFGPKTYSKRPPLRVPDSMMPCTEPLEKCTINKLSYLPYDICNNPPPKPMMQYSHIVRPIEPGERCTVQKLSYLPVPLPAKEPMPWAERVRVVPPKAAPFCTTYNLSYIPNCSEGKTPLVAPVSAIQLFGKEMMEKNTVYRLSYLSSNGCKPDPIFPKPGITLSTGIPMEKCTVYKLSYLPQFGSERTQPIRPRMNVYKSTDAIQDITTQKHDFVPKACTRRGLIIPPTSMTTPNCPMERCTVNKLSYLPVTNPIKSAPIIPKAGLCSYSAPMSKCTTYKLSYMPVPLPPKEALPWARQTACMRSMAPIEKCTIQRLSYGAPGNFMKATGKCNCSCVESCTVPAYPTAAVC